MTPATDPIDPVRPDRRSQLAWTAAALLGTLIVFRAIVSIDLFPAWSNDPLLLPTPNTSLGPTAIIAIDSAVTALAGLLLCLVPATPALTAMIESALLLAGVAAVAAHCVQLHPDSPDDLVLGISWIAAMTTGLAARRAAGVPGLRALLAAILVGSVAILAAKGIVQVAFEHPAALASFRANKAEHLAAQGWTVGSPSALAFERRVAQAEATAWFGLANIVATLAAAATLTFLAFTLAALRDRDEKEPRSRARAALPLLGAIISFTLLVLAGSKGGYAALALGALVLAARELWPRTGNLRLSRTLRWAPPLLVLLVLAGVAVRGLIGERLGELSLLFRAFYAQAAARIFADHPLSGVGPAGFKDAYLIAKNPASPEEVTSPHNMLLDFPATLGLGGVLWASLIIAWICTMGRPLSPLPEGGAGGGLVPAAPVPLSRETLRRLVVWIFVLLGLATSAAVRVEGPAGVGTPEGAASRVLGLFAAVALAACILSVGHRRPAALAAALALGGIALAMLGLIDLAPTNVSSCVWYMAWLGLSNGCSAAPRARSLATLLPSLATCIAAAAAVALSVFCSGVEVRTWERSLRESARDLDELSELRLRWKTLASLPPGAAPEDRRRLDKELLEKAGVSLSAPPLTILERIDSAQSRYLPNAEAGLRRAVLAAPGHAPTREAWSRLALSAAQRRAPALAITTWEALARQASVVPVGPGQRQRASALAWRATVLQALGRPADEIVETLTQAAAIDPYAAHHPQRIAFVFDDAGRRDEARPFAAEALRLDALTHLDPLKGFGEKDRARLHAIAGSQ